MIDWNKSAAKHKMSVVELQAYFEKYPSGVKYKVCTICDGCGEERWKSFYRYRGLCHKCSNRKLAKDPEYRETMRKIYESLVWRKNVTEANRKKAGNSEYQETRRKMFENPQYRKNRAEVGRKYWSDIENRINMSCIRLCIKREEWDGFKKAYCDLWTEELREHIREKYDRKCFICGLPEFENKFKNGKQVKLSVHHVDYNKQCDCDGTECRLVPLCIEHHGQTTSGDREMWEEIITDMIDNLIEK